MTLRGKYPSTLKRATDSSFRGHDAEEFVKEKTSHSRVLYDLAMLSAIQNVLYGLETTLMLNRK